MATERGTYAIGELAGLAGSTPRTIRYYVAQGLLPAPVGVGPGAHYTDDHLARLRLIRRLQRQHQPLSEIRQRVSSLAEQDVVDLLGVEEPGESPTNSALDYLRELLAPPSQDAALAPSVPVPPSSMPAPLAVRATGGGAALFRSAVPAMPTRAAESTDTYATPVPPPVVPPTESPTTEQRSQWDRIALTPNIEIHVRRPLGRLENRRVERLITIARQVLREEQP